MRRGPRPGRGIRVTRSRVDVAAETDWRRLLECDDVHLVDICPPGDSHAEIAVAALRAGKHVLCEKPLANSVAEAEAMVAAAETARARGRLAMVGFHYRRTPAVAPARRMIRDGRIGTLRHVRAGYLQDWLVDPEAPLTWRLRREQAGSGALGDLGAHLVALAQYLAGGWRASRRSPAPSYGNGRGTVTVDAAALFTGRFPSGALAFDLERLNELAFHDRTEPADAVGFRRILATEPGHPYLEAWWPPGHGLGYEHTFVHQARDLVYAIAAGTEPAPAFADGLQVQRVLAAVEDRAAKDCTYTPVPCS
ncbi:dehydrogenase [Streptomyces sp. WAC 06783]|nr:dehydrogenase [Streptomyces sp. WAC 06783]